MNGLEVEVVCKHNKAQQRLHEEPRLWMKAVTAASARGIGRGACWMQEGIAVAERGPALRTGVWSSLLSRFVISLRAVLCGHA